MPQFTQESEFDKRLSRISELYESGKDDLNNITWGFLPPGERTSITRLFETLRELRDIAAINLKSNHEIKDN